MRQVEWEGVTDRSDFLPGHVSQIDRLANAARNARWAEVLDLLAKTPNAVNRPRIGGTSGYTVLHHAAWNGAPPDVVRRLLDLGAWRRLRSTRGQLPVDLAARRGHAHLIDLLRPAPAHPVADDVLAALEQRLHQLVTSRMAEFRITRVLRLPQVAPLTELVEPVMWFPVPGMYGGFAIELQGPELQVKSWCRVLGGSARTHRITARDMMMVESGWDI
ncbi:ankyrin repeat domain-containing protein [Streptoalloteichus hindustanus]|nr:ankyrin repeat domain-containing protein [Streptoalloteichus hindustanus]